MTIDGIERLEQEGLKRIVIFRNDNDNTLRMLFDADDFGLILVDKLIQKLRRRPETIIADVCFRKGHAYLMWVLDMQELRC